MENVSEEKTDSKVVHEDSPSSLIPEFCIRDGSTMFEDEIQGIPIWRCSSNPNHFKVRL